MANQWQGMNWIRQDKRLAIYLRDRFACVYCGVSLRGAAPGTLTLDHLTPRCQGGTNAAENLVTACRPCNSSRQDRDWQAFAPSAVVQRQIETLRSLDLARFRVMAQALLAGETGDAVEALR